ncbi:MAG: hypothetical protein Q9207_007248 [Kuettlingeria erythrocarpa]
MDFSEAEFIQDEELWVAPELKGWASPFMAFLRHRTRNNITTGHERAWTELDPDEQARYGSAEYEVDVARYEADVQAFNDRIPLSPLVEKTVPRFNRGYEWAASRERLRRRGVQLWNRYRKDHPEACGGPVVPVPDQPFRFLDLPLELRANVYRLLLYRTRSVVQMETNGTASYYHPESSDEGPLDLRVFAVSKQVYEEATTTFFTHNLIQINLGDDLPPMFRNSAQASSSSLVSRVRRVEIRLPLYRAMEIRRLSWLVQRLCQTLAARTQLTEVRVVPFCPRSWYLPQLHQVMDDILENFTGLRGIPHVYLVDQAGLAMIKEQPGLLSDKVHPTMLRGVPHVYLSTQAGWPMTGEQCRGSSDIVLSTEGQRQRIQSIMNSQDQSPKEQKTP